MTNPDAFAIVLEYLYTKDLNVVGNCTSGDVLLDSFALANQYCLEPLKYKLEALIALSVTVENVCSLLVLADAYQAEQVRIYAIVINNSNIFSKIHLYQTKS